MFSMHMWHKWNGKTCTILSEKKKMFKQFKDVQWIFIEFRISHKSWIETMLNTCKLLKTYDCNWSFYIYPNIYMYMLRIPLPNRGRRFILRWEILSYNHPHLVLTKDDGNSIIDLSEELLNLCSLHAEEHAYWRANIVVVRFY